MESYGQIACTEGRRHDQKRAWRHATHPFHGEHRREDQFFIGRYPLQVRTPAIGFSNGGDV